MKRLLLVVALLLVIPGQLALAPKAHAQVASISVSPSVVQCGNSVSVQGFGWPANSTINIGIPGLSPDQVQTTQATTDNGGGFFATLFIPSTVAAGNYNVSAQFDTTSPVTAPLTIQCGGGFNAQITPFPQQVSAGDTLTVQGTGWPANSNISVSVGNPSGPLFLTGNAFSDPSGSFSTSFTIPFGTPSGTYTITAQLGTSTPVTSSFQVLGANPQIRFSPNTAAPGGSVTIFGTGFPVGGFVTATVSCNGGQTQQSGTASGSGELALTITVPASATSGTCNVQISNGAQVLASGSFQVQQNAQIALQPNAAPAGGTVNVVGSGFTPGSSPTAQVTFNLQGGGVQTVSTQPAFVSGSGTFSAPLNIPTGAIAGQYTVTVLPTGFGGPTLSATLTVTQSASITLVPATALPANGSTVQVLGSGFSPYEQVTVSYLGNLAAGGQQLQQTTTTANGNGDFSASLPVPVTISAANTYQVTATGQSSGRTARANLTVSIAGSQLLQANPSTVNHGATVTFTGQNFPTPTNVTVSANVPLIGGGTQPVSATATVGATRTFNATVTIPANAAPGPVTFTATAVGPTSGTTYTATTVVNITNSPTLISVNPTTVQAGGQVVVTGSNFASGPGNLVDVVLTYTLGGQRQVQQQRIDTDANGNFTVLVNVPAGASSGGATITATQQASGDNASAGIAVQAQATPTALPTNTPTPTSTPTPTATPLPPTPTPTPVPLKMKFKSASLWYQIARVGTFNHVSLQANQGGRISVHTVVSFPNGSQISFSGHTHGAGKWSKTFPIPPNAISGSNNRASVKIRLQKGSRGVGRTLTFTLIH